MILKFRPQEMAATNLGIAGPAALDKFLVIHSMQMPSKEAEEGRTPHRERIDFQMVHETLQSVKMGFTVSKVCWHKHNHPDVF